MQLGVQAARGLWVDVVLLSSWAHVTKHLPIPAGDPLQCGAWMGQCALYIVIMIFEKSVVFIVLLILQWKKVCLLPLHVQLPAEPSDSHITQPQPACFCFSSVKAWIWSDRAALYRVLICRSRTSVHALPVNTCLL